jgi:two-component system, chemotaxis family, sensor kinase CheA
LHGKGLAGAGRHGKETPMPLPSGEGIRSEDEFEHLLDELHGKGKAPATFSPAPPSRAATRPGVSARLGSGSEGGQQKARPGPAAPAETSVRVDTKRLDDIMNLVGELVLVRNRLGHPALEAGR